MSERSPSARAVGAFDRPLALVGLRGAGKSSVGRALAAALGRPLVDLDRAVEAGAGCTIAALFATRGEAAFRDLEAAALARALTDAPPPVVATGGGVVLRAENRAALAGAFVVYLAAPPDLLAARVAADPGTGGSRPALAPGGPLAEAAALLAARDPLYRAVAHAVVDATGPLDEVAARVAAALDG